MLVINIRLGDMKARFSILILASLMLLGISKRSSQVSSQAHQHHHHHLQQQQIPSSPSSSSTNAISPQSVARAEVSAVIPTPTPLTAAIHLAGPNETAFASSAPTAITNINSGLKTMVALDSQLDNNGNQMFDGSVDIKAIETAFQEEPLSENRIDIELPPTLSPSSFKILTDKQYLHVPCGTLSVNKTKLLVRNPYYPEPTYSKSICETVIKRADPTINKLTIRFRLLQLYRPTFSGQCLHDRFAVFTDLNALLTPVICGDNSGKTITVPFPNQTSVIISITTSDLDHDRYWWIEIDQEK